MSIFRISPLGTCRIHTPLRRGAAHYPYVLALGRNYGFVHSSREVLAQLAVLRGGKPAPEELWPLAYRPGTTVEFLTGPVDSPDLYMVEISSAKHVSVDDVPVQINYLYRHFQQFFADAARTAEYWKRTRHQPAAERRAWLEGLPVFAALDADSRHLLGHVHLHVLSAEEIAADMAAIVDQAGDTPVHFITHVDALTAAGQPIASRRALISLVARTARELDAPCHDPTALMLKIGQHLAMENGGRDLTHYAPAFSDQLIDQWYAQSIEPLIGLEARAAALPGVPALRHLRALVAEGQLAEAARSAWAHVRAGERVTDHYRILAAISSRLHDHERVISLLGKVRKTDSGNAEDMALLMRAHAALGNHAQALRSGEALLADTPETAELLFVCACAAGMTGREDKANFYWQRLLTREMSSDTTNVADNADNIDAADHAGDGVDNEEPDERQPAGRALPALNYHPDSLRQLWAAALAHSDWHRLLWLAEAGYALTPSDIWEMAKQAVEAGQLRVAAMLLAPHVTQAGADRRLRAWAIGQARHWVTSGLAALEQEEQTTAIDHISAGRQLAPRAAWVMQAERRLASALRPHIRAAYTAGDHEQVIQFAHMVTARRLSLPGVDFIFGRSAAALGNMDEALKYLRRAVAEDPAPRTRLHLARVATQCGDHALAVANCGAILADRIASSEERQRAASMLAKRTSSLLRFIRERLAAGEVRTALSTLQQLAAHVDDEARIAREFRRVRQHVRDSLAAADMTAAEQVEELAGIVCDAFADDAELVRRAADAAMQAGAFPTARRLWQQLADLGEQTDRAETMIVRCDQFIRRSRVQEAA